MDPLLKPIKTILPSGLTVITMRTGNVGLIAGELAVKTGTAHATMANPDWEGLPHFTEHLIANSASRKFAQDEAKRLLIDKFFLNFNAGTNLYETRYFTQLNKGYVLPSDRFWGALEVTIDGVFYPKFDTPTLERERLRILQEISQNLTSLRIDDARYSSLLWGVDYVALQTLGTKERVAKYQ